MRLFVKSLISIFILLCYSTVAPAQKIKSRITDSLNQAIPYCGVGYLHHSLGTTSDSLGNFSLPYFRDTVRISCLGFQNLLIAASEITDEIKLTKVNDVILAPVIVTNRIHETITVGHDFKKLNYFERLGFHIQTAVLIHNRSTVMSKINSVFLRLRETQENCHLLRIRFLYQNSTTQHPDKEINNKEIIIKPSSLQRNSKIDLSSYNIYIQPEDFFICFEWLPPSDTCKTLPPFLAGTMDDEVNYVEISHYGIEWNKGNSIRSHTGKFRTPYVVLEMSY